MTEAGAAPEPATPVARARPARSAAVWISCAVAGLFLLLSCFSVWVDRVLFETEVFVDTSTELIEDDAIRQAVATRAVDELFESVDVEAELEQRLPQDYKRLSGPARAALREASYTLVGRALQQPRLQRLWGATVEQSHQTLIRVLEGDDSTVSTAGGVVTLDLERIVLEAADRIGIREQVEDNLPEDVGRIEILRSDELDTAQDAFSLLNALAWLLPFLTLGAFALAVWLAGDRRRAVRRIGVTVLLVGLVGLVAVNLVGNYLLSSLVADTETRVAAESAWDILTGLLRNSFRWLAMVGVVFVVAAWLAGPGPRAVAARRYLAPAVRDRVWAYAGLAALALLLLLTGPVADSTRFLVVAILFALGAVWVETLRRQTLGEYPGASAAAIVDEARERIARWWALRREPLAGPERGAPAAPQTDLTAALVSLADLHARGELTAEEYAAAKARVLAGS